MSGAFTIIGAQAYDPLQGWSGEVRTVHIKDGKFVAAAEADGRGEVLQADGCVVMAGAIDLHTHIAGGKVNIARALLPELQSAAGSHCTPGTWITGHRYAEMGFTSCFEPAVLPVNARQAHMEMGDTPLVDSGGYALLGNDDFFLTLLAGNESQALINDYVAWTLEATRCVAIKVVNPGGINAFKFNARSMDLDQAHPHYGVTPRQVLVSLATAVHDLGLPHPLHVHGCNLGVPGNSETTLKTMAAVDGLPLHLTHVQFHSYGTEGDHHFSSDAQRLAEVINASPHLSVDVGQVMFGQTVTASADNMSQYRNSPLASPKKSVIMDIECEAGCGVVPFRYKEKNFVNGLQWAIGLELFLSVRDPWRIFLTTDHPNGAPFTCYPTLIRLLMDRAYREECFARLDPAVANHSTLKTLTREYTLDEIAIMTRAAPARILGLPQHGALRPGDWADAVVYSAAAGSDVERMFAKPRWVFKNGEMVVREGQVIRAPNGRPFIIRPQYDRHGIHKRLEDYFARHHTLSVNNYAIGEDELLQCRHGQSPHVIPCGPRTR